MHETESPWCRSVKQTKKAIKQKRTSTRLQSPPRMEPLYLNEVLTQTPSEVPHL